MRFSVSRRALTLGLCTGLFTALSACGSGGGSSEPAKDPGWSSITTLQITDTVVGTGAVATSGQKITVHYTGWLYDQNATDKRGAKFDSSVDRGAPFSFQLGVGQVIPGWDQGVAGMKVGGKRTLIIPASLGYGQNGAGPIPPGAALVFDVQLVSIP